ncbi:LamG domain-containing protein [Gilvibacter sp.]|uniref:LamG domain-containing protein n=1 Tax=Gilvibacter sp. TaxID=2729997 RepID=UPI0025BBF3C4|nr:LamG domain-containing protein [Gilvibacter sp.]NQX78797.1 LamG domain-containing protein [Gilvibacter sp.]
MSSLQNPLLPIPTNPVDIDRAIVDLQLVLSTNLSWLTHAYGRTYKLADQTKGQTLYLPEVYLGGTDLSKRYFSITPDNDKQGQCFFLVRRLSIDSDEWFVKGRLKYDLDLVFSVNLALINDALLETELFTANLESQVRDVLRSNVGKGYRLELQEVFYDSKDIWNGLSVEIATIEKAPLQHFRMKCSVLLDEQCSTVPYDRCSALQRNLSDEDRNACLLPTYDFSNATVQSNVTPSQQVQLSDWLCTAPVPTRKSMDISGTGRIFGPVDPVYDFEYNTPFSLSCWVKIDSNGVNNLFNHYISSPGKGYFFITLPNGSLRVDLQNTQSIRLSISTPPNAFPLNDWVHCMMTYDGSSTVSGLNIYVNSALQLKTATTQTLGANSIRNGLMLFFGQTMDGSNSLQGKVADFKVWDRELTSQEVVSEYNDRASLTAPVPSGLVLWCECGNNAQFGAFDYTMPDKANVLTGFQTLGVPIGRVTTDVP